MRVDSDSFDGTLLAFLEARSLPYFIVASMIASIKLLCAGVRVWRALGDDYAVGGSRPS